MSCIYNNIPISYVRTDRLVSGPEKDPSGSDQTLTTIMISVAGVVNPQLLGMSGADAGATVARIRHLLTAPRRPFYFDLTSPTGATTGNPIINLPDGRDDAGGPWPDPGAFAATYVTPQTIEVVWTVTVKLRDCDASSVAADPLSIRWDDSIGWDRDFKATWNRSGTCIISSRSQDTIDYIRRNRLAPTVPPGFARTSARYTVSRDGLRCDFSFTDEQLRYAPPYPAATMSLRQSEVTAKTGVGTRSGEVVVNMRGVQNADPVDLQKWCLTVAAARVFAAGTAKSGNVLGQVAFSMDDNPDSVACTCSVQYKINVQKGRELLGGLPLKNWPSALPGNPNSAGTQPNAVGSQNRAASAALYPWVGFGTSKRSPTNPTGYATWANPTGAVVVPADGVGLATALGFFAALLSDPCGQKVETTPYASTVQTIRQEVGAINFDTPTAGQGGSPATKPQTVTAALSGLNSSQYPAVVQQTDENGFYVWDGTPAPYDYWQCENEYYGSVGTLVMPTGDPNGVNVKVDLNSPSLCLIKRWAASRTGALPALPQPNTGDPNMVYTDGAVMPREMMVAADGVSEHYEVRGWYRYEFLDPRKVNIAAEVPPFLSRPAVGTTNNLALEDLGNPLVGGNSVLGALLNAAGISQADFNAAITPFGLPMLF